MDKCPANDSNEQYKTHSAEINSASPILTNIEANVFTINELYYCYIWHKKKEHSVILIIFVLHNYLYSA